MGLFKRKSNSDYEKIILQKIEKLEKERQELWELSQDAKLMHNVLLGDTEACKQLTCYTSSLNSITYCIFRLREVLYEARA